VHWVVVRRLVRAIEPVAGKMMIVTQRRRDRLNIQTTDRHQAE